MHNKIHFCENNCPIQSILRREEIEVMPFYVCVYSYSCMNHLDWWVGGVDCLHLHTKMQKNVFIYLWVCFQTFKMCIYIFLSILPIIFRLHFWSVLFSISRCRPKRRTFYGNVFIRGGSMATNDPQQGRRLTLGPRNKTFEIRNISYPLVLLTCPASQYFIWKSIRLSWWR